MFKICIEYAIAFAAIIEAVVLTTLNVCYLTQRAIE